MLAVRSAAAQSPNVVCVTSATPPIVASEGQTVPSGSDPNGTSIFSALQDQLGLKLESGKGPIEIIVIDHIEKASGN